MTRKTVGDERRVGRLEVSSGSVSGVSVGAVGDSDTGLFFPAANTVGVSTGGGERVRITSAGNVGIGTSSPQRALHVASSGVPLRLVGSEAGSGIIEQHNSRGTLAAPTAVLAADRLGGFIASGYDGTNYVLSSRIMVEANQDFTTTARGTRFTVQVTPNDSTTATERMRVAGDGLITGTGTSLGAWTAYTPTLSNWTLGNGSVSGRYCQIGKFVIVRGSLIFGSTSTFSGELKISLPITAQDAGRTGSTFTQYIDASGGVSFFGVMRPDTTTTMVGAYLGTNGQQTATSSTGPFAWAVNDSVRFAFMYEAA